MFRDFKEYQANNGLGSLEHITRFEVIDENGRAYARHFAEVTVSLQDDNKTLKIFIKGRKV